MFDIVRELIVHFSIFLRVILCDPTVTVLECDGAADIVFAVDVSGSILSHRFEWVKTFLHDVVDQLEIHPNKTRIGLITFR